jgi:mannose-6-phosphate isomerase-like protein (cupin superfamily)
MEKYSRPWGHYEILLDDENYKVKRIVIDPYQKFSLQYHNYRTEHWVVVEGSGKIILDGSENDAEPNTFWYVGKESVHRAEAGGDGLVLIETQMGKCYEEDIVRIQDDYDRA